MVRTACGDNRYAARSRNISNSDLLAGEDVIMCSPNLETLHRPCSHWIDISTQRNDNKLIHLLSQPPFDHYPDANLNVDPSMEITIRVHTSNAANYLSHNLSQDND
jgi:hypothetical protein